MRRKLIIATTAGALGLAGLAAAAPALADRDADRTGAGVEWITGALAGLVSDGSITQAQADEVAGALSEAAPGGWGEHHGRGPGLEAAATALGMTEDELRTALREDGTTLADVAQARGVPVQTLVDALVADATERIRSAVDDGRLTQEQADERLADLEQRVTDRVNGEFPMHGDHGPDGDHGMRGDHGGMGPGGGMGHGGGMGQDGREHQPAD